MANVAMKTISERQVLKISRSLSAAYFGMYAFTPTNANQFCMYSTKQRLLLPISFKSPA